MKISEAFLRINKFSPLVIIVALLGIVWPSTIKANLSQWPAFHGDSARTGFSDSKIPSSPNVLWEITTGQLKEYGVDNFEIHSPIIDQNKVFFSSVQVFAADLSSGKILWNYKGDRPDFFADTVAAGDGKIFVRVTNSSLLKNMFSGFIYAFDEETGKLLWKYQTKKQISHSNPLFAEGKVFVGDESGTVYAIEANSGKLVWQKQLEALWIHSSPAYEQGVIYVGTETSDIGDGKTGRGSFLYALGAKDGRVLWRFESDWRGYDMANFIHGTPAVLDDAVYFGSENGYFYALNKDSGQLIWKKIITKGTRTFAREAEGSGLVGVSTAPALGYGKIFVGTWEGNFLALSQKDGATVWEYPYGTEGTDSSAVVADKKVCLGSHYEYFYCFNEGNGKVLWKEKLGGPSAALSGGILVVPNALAGESPGSILVAFSDRGIPGASNPIVSIFSFDNPNFQKAVAAILGLVLVVIFYKLLQSRKITVKQLLIYGGIPLVLVVAGYVIYSNYMGSKKTEQQDALIKEGKIDPATGSFIANDGSPKHIEYQGRKYFLDGGFCSRSGLERFSIQVKRVNGAAGAEGGDGNTMYAIGSKNNPEYIGSSKASDTKKDCWKGEPQ
ncbi:PQQ-binding-like beta-propeller repeat protein [Candidatus Daviesbacteria bacterium]|nr:PQQ-binding-like beta-propeller repeat protein [Candidatus Daviesbacteria bacterium]